MRLQPPPPPAAARAARLNLIVSATMEVSINANMCDRATERIASALHAPLRVLSRALSQDYGGTMEHLWIDLELIERCGKRPWAFRYQKKVSGSAAAKLTGVPMPVYEHGGHYSVTPDFAALARVPIESVVGYVLTLIYLSTSVLFSERRELGDFDVQGFRSQFRASCERHGYPLQGIDDAR
jgi:hypothetical protein